MAAPWHAVWPGPTTGIRTDRARDNPSMTTIRPQAIILFAHGARDDRWSRTLLDLSERVRSLNPATIVSVAFLEFQPPTLESALAEAVQHGCTHIDIVPVFWASGGHVASDVPPLLDAIREKHPQLRVRLAPVLSELPGLLDFVAAAVVRFSSD